MMRSRMQERKTNPSCGGQAGFEARAGAGFPGREAPQHRAPHGLLQRGEMGTALQFERHLTGLEANKAIVSFE